MREPIKLNVKGELSTTGSPTTASSYDSHTSFLEFLLPYHCPFPILLLLFSSSFSFPYLYLFLFTFHFISLILFPFFFRILKVSFNFPSLATKTSVSFNFNCFSLFLIFLFSLSDVFLVLSLSHVPAGFYYYSVISYSTPLLRTSE